MLLALLSFLVVVQPPPFIVQGGGLYKGMGRLKRSSVRLCECECVWAGTTVGLPAH
jgi:hypothetical protein